jgi:hypothetical protein
MSIISLNQIHNSQLKTWTQVISVLSVIIGVWSLRRMIVKHKCYRGVTFTAMSLMFVVVWLIVIHPALNKAMHLHNRITCVLNIRDIELMLSMYANDNEGYLPDKENWCDLILPYKGELEGKNNIFKCPNDPLGPSSYAPCSYALNSAVSGRKFEDLPDNMVIVFESQSGWNLSGGKELINFRNHPMHDTCSILTQNGVKQALSAEEIAKDMPGLATGKLQWVLKQ